MTDDSAPGGDTAESAPDAATRTDENMIPKARLDEEIAKRKAAESEMATLAETLANEIPEKFRGLVPAELSAAGKVKWIRDAKAAGVFAVAVPETDTAPPKTTPRDRDLSNLTPHARIAAGYERKA